MRPLAAVAAVIALAVAATPADAEERVATEPAPFTADTYGDVVAWSAYDRGAGVYRLRVQRGSVRVDPPVAPSQQAFDLDVGRGPDGAPLVVYARAGDVFQWDPATAREQPLAEVNTAADESLPTIHLSALAFARGRRVYLRRDGNTRRQPRPRFSREISVEELELSSRGLFAVYRTDIVPTCCSKATLFRIAGGRLRHVFSVPSGGANVGRVVSPSVLGRNVFFGRTNQGSGQGNRFFRYDLRSGRLFAARGTSRARSLTWRGDRFLMSRDGPGCLSPPQEPTTHSCELVLTDAIPFTRATRADVRRTRP